MTKLNDALTRFEAAHREDLRTLRGEPHSVVYHRRLGHWVEQVHPDPPEAMRLAAGCQHIRRWEIPRADFPEGRTGYKQWRSRLAQFHAETARSILEEVGYDDATCERVRDFLIKKRLKSDSEVQAFEDAICLVFLENEFADFRTKHDDAKMVDIVQKTWAKMSPKGHELAKTLLGQLPEDAQDLLLRALS